MNSSLMLSGWGKLLGKKLMKQRLKPRPAEDPQRWNIVRGDNVQVIQGPQSGQKGKVLTVIRDKCRVIVEGVNMRSRNIKPKSDGTPGKKIIQPCSLHYSNIMLIDPTTGEPTKTSRRFLEDGTKVRVSKKTGNVIPKPDPLFDRRPRSYVVGPKDTAVEDVFRVSFADYTKYLPFIYAKEANK